MSDELFSFALDLAREAGSVLRGAYGTIDRNEIGYKGWRNLVTAVDLEVERRLRDRIGSRYPDHAILAEEGAAREGSSSYRWIIDPLDGTTNFVHRHPMYCVSIALEDADGLLLGLVYAPQLEEMFSARRGQGALFNQTRPVRVSEERELSHALLASGFAYRQGEEVNTNLGNWSALSLCCRGLRRCGAAALDLAYVADGRYDGFWELYLSPWDVAAGALLVQEAGGRVTDAAGGDAWLEGSSILATNGLLHEELRGRLRTD
jgi:myo-inositol-1(or 4)-monophosphatase